LPRRTWDVHPVTDDCGARKDTHLNDIKQYVVGAISDRYDSSRFLLGTNKDTCRYTLHAATTFTPAETALIYFHNFAKLPSPQHKKKAVRKTQIKKNIALRQNCDQAGTILWSTQSSA